MLERRSWVPGPCEDLVQSIAAQTARQDSEAVFHEIARLVAENRRIHDQHGINLNPASNVMNPKAEAMMASGLARAPRSATPATSTRWAWRRSSASR